MATPVDSAAAQHLAHLRQEDSLTPVLILHQQQALAVVQALERDRLDLRQAALTQAGLEAHLQQLRQERK